MAGDPTATLFRALRAYLAAVHPRFELERVKLVGRGGDKIDLRVIADNLPAPAPDDAGKLRPSERRILATAAGLEEENPTGEEIARAARLPYEPSLRRILSSLRERGYFGGAKGEPGYPITVKGLEALEPADDVGD